MTKKDTAREAAETQEVDLHTPEVIERLNAPRAWEELNPNWVEEGNLTHHFAKSQFASCPGCGKFEHLEIYVASEDLDVAVLCRPCGWQVFGDCPSEAIDNWNRRAEAGRLAAGRWRGLELLCRIRQWDTLDTAADGDYWKSEIDAVLDAHNERRAAEKI